MVSMTERRIRHLPVTDGDGLLGGIVSIGDVVKARLGQLETENQALFDYITHGR
jgi:CBS domain-containing protein